MMARYQVAGDLTAPLAELSDSAYYEMRCMPVWRMNLRQTVDLLLTCICTYVGTGGELHEFVSSQVTGQGSIFQVVVSRSQRARRTGARI